VACQVVTRKQVLTNRMLLRPANKAKRLRMDPWDALAAYLVARYRPRLLVTFLNSTALAAPLKCSMEAAGGIHVNIAHSLLAPHTLEPFPPSHYLFAFGESSIQACRSVQPPAWPVKLVKTGSLYLDARHAPPPVPSSRRVLFASTWIPKGFETIYLPAFKIVASWARSRPDFRMDVKPHPLPDDRLTRRFFQGLPNVCVLPRDVSPDAAFQALAPASLVLSPFSCFSLEAAVAGRPSVVVGPAGEDNDMLKLSRFFPPVADAVEALDQAVEANLTDYSAAVARCGDFAAHHLDRLSGALEYIVDCLEEIFHGREAFPIIDLPAATPERSVRGLKTP